MTVSREASAAPVLGRRGVLGFRLAAAVAAVVPPVLLSSAPAEAAMPAGGVRRVALRNINTGDVFDGVYWANGAYRPDALRRLDVVLRDHRANVVGRFDPRLFDALCQLQQRMGADEPFEVVCGFRSKRTNAIARRRSRGVAKESYHTRAMAVDIHLPGHSLRGLAETAKSLGAGGVGYYPRSGFVHVDTGPVRHW